MRVEINKFKDCVDIIGDNSKKLVDMAMDFTDSFKDELAVLFKVSKKFRNLKKELLTISVKNKMFFNLSDSYTYNMKNNQYNIFERMVFMNHLVNNFDDKILKVKFKVMVEKESHGGINRIYVYTLNLSSKKVFFINESECDPQIRPGNSWNDYPPRKQTYDFNFNNFLNFLDKGKIEIMQIFPKSDKEKMINMLKKTAKTVLQLNKITESDKGYYNDNDEEKFKERFYFNHDGMLEISKDIITTDNKVSWKVHNEFYENEDFLNFRYKFYEYGKRDSGYGDHDTMLLHINFIIKDNDSKWITYCDIEHDNFINYIDKYGTNLLIENITKIFSKENKEFQKRIRNKTKEFKFFNEKLNKIHSVLSIMNLSI